MDCNRNTLADGQLFVNERANPLTSQVPRSGPRRIVAPWDRRLLPAFMACQILIHGGVRFRQRKGRDLDVKLFFTLLNHLVGAVHLAEWRCKRTA